jgi:hypothetical protein
MLAFVCPNPGERGRGKTREMARCAQGLADHVAVVDPPSSEVFMKINVISSNRPGATPLRDRDRLERAGLHPEQTNWPGLELVGGDEPEAPEEG